MNDTWTGKTFEDCWTIDEALVGRFADLSGDHNPVHMNTQEAQAYGFPRRVAHGALSVALLSRLIGMRIPGPGALWLGHQIEWRSPVYVGDQLTMLVEVRHFSEAAAMLQLTFHGKNQRGEIVLEGEARVKVNAKLSGGAKMTGKTVALVTGGSRGIGAAIARRLAAQGCSVAVNYLRDETSAMRVIHDVENAGSQGMLVQGDVSTDGCAAKIIDSVCEVLGHPNVIIHGATPRLTSVRFPDVDCTDVEPFFRTYVTGGLQLLRRAAPGMMEQKFGRFIFLGTSALFGPPPSGYGAYLIAKSALWGLVRSAAQELGPSGITVNMVSPGLTITDLTGDLPSRVKEIEVRKIAARRLATVDDTAALVAFLPTPEAGYLNGVNIPLTGGPI